jgi:hypothetical protein
MSKCKPALDGEKITEIRVITKTQGNLQRDQLEPKNPAESRRVSASAPQQSA